MNKSNEKNLDVSELDETDVNETKSNLNSDQKNSDTKENLDNSKDKEIEKLTQELETQKNLLLRTAAEYENFRKRTEREKSAIYSDSTADAISTILPIADSIERALQSINGANEEYKKGIEMISNQFNESLEKLGVESFGKEGDAFNPDFHNAISHIDDENLGENVISRVFQKGYKLSDKVIRYAMVQAAN